ncbi:prion-inhibition and propagation-domain-containing protein [Chaetomidium leptoderma]|uniref:Prion-inhibition and propagation-domain-containing protein n=1 Tax=Chaetomidium leptoderma TaxID=669021 RepID=A0AAN6ZT84_9PEZI|nr:prion-inhibition and propagation-domain-containing protein [Chaetomidium leptoderma]
MEVAGLVIGIAGLYSPCGACYEIYTGIKDATRDREATADQLKIQESILKSWSFHWEIKPELPEIEAADTKLGRYLTRNPYKADGIARALRCVIDALSDRRKLLETYGLKVDLGDFSVPGTTTQPTTTQPTATQTTTRTLKQLGDDMKNKSKEVLSRIAQSRSVPWVLKDGKKFKALIADLIQHNDSLYRLGPEWFSELLPVYLVLDYLPRQPPPSQQDSGEPTAASASESGNDSAQPAVGFKSEVVRSETDDPLTPEQETRLLCFKAKDLVPGKKDMAVCLPRRETVFLERHPYHCEDGDGNQEARIRTNILKLGQLVQLPVCKRHLQALELVGLVDVVEYKEIDFIYRLPGALGQQRPRYPIYDMVIRAPVNLSALLAAQHSCPPPALGSRFDLARKLVRSVAFLHAGGWVHKNIRSGAVHFFSKPGASELSRDLADMDIEHPFLLGHEFSRPDNKGQSQTVQVQQEEEHEEQQQQQPAAPDQEATNGAFMEDGLSESDYKRSLTSRSKYSITSHQRRITLDWNHHPFKLTFPDRRYCPAFDVYSLGITLLEIGLWMPIGAIWKKYSDSKGHDDDDEEVDYFENTRQLIRIARSRLPRACGDLYTRVTVSCLGVEPEDSEDGRAEQRELCARIVADLAQCQV